MSALQGKRIVITRPLAQAQELVELLKAHQAIPVLFPVIETVMVEDLALLDKVLKEIDSFNWILFTSVNGVTFFFKYVEQSKETDHLPIPWERIKVAAIGPKTAEALTARGIQPTLIPQSYVQEDFAHCLKQRAKPGEKMLFPKAVYTRDILSNQLASFGVELVEVPVYETRGVKQDTGMFLEKLRKKELDAITFTSSSTVKHFLQLFKEEERKELEHYLKGLVLASIGPITTRTLRAYGLNIQVEAREFTAAGLVKALADYYEKE